jgi:CHAD domain-containing protein
LLSARIDVFSRKRLHDWQNWIRRRGRDLEVLRPRQLHRLRIRCKRYRYIVDALRPLGLRLSRRTLAFHDIARQVHGTLGDIRDLSRLRRAGGGHLPGHQRMKRKLLKRAQNLLSGGSS